MESTIIVLPKEGRDLLNPSSYRPICLLGADVKILARILASRLKKIITKYIHPDQSGFMPNSATSINIRKAYLNLQVPMSNTGSRAILSLDVTKAFDSLEWQYLLQVLGAFQFGSGFVNWIKLLY